MSHEFVNLICSSEEKKSASGVTYSVHSTVEITPDVLLDHLEDWLYVGNVQTISDSLVSAFGISPVVLLLIGNIRRLVDVEHITVTQVQAGPNR